MPEAGSASFPSMEMTNPPQGGRSTCPETVATGLHCLRFHGGQDSGSTRPETAEHDSKQAVEIRQGEVRSLLFEHGDLLAQGYQRMSWMSPQTIEIVAE